MNYRVVCVESALLNELVNTAIKSRRHTVEIYRTPLAL